MSESGSQEAGGAAENGGGSPTKRAPRPAVGNRVTVVLGAQWGDEGKGKVVDLLAQDADMVCRCQLPCSHFTTSKHVNTTKSEKGLPNSETLTF